MEQQTPDAHDLDEAPYAVDPLDDADMVRIYTRENVTQRGTSGTAMAGSMAAAERLLATAVLAGNTGRILPVSARAEARGLWRLLALVKAALGVTA